MDGIDVSYYEKKIINRSPQKWKEDGFIIIPHKTILNNKINKNGLLVFMSLRMHQFQMKTSCFPSIQTIQKETRLSPNSIRNGISNLIDAGYLNIEKHPGRTNTYFLHDKRVWKGLEMTGGSRGMSIKNHTLDR
jgi:uncharacterized protein YllA (UPF0747 family)